MSTKSYKDTVFLPKTSFSMRADLTNKEPRIIEEWRKQDLDKKLQNRFKDAPRYTQHDGPPYANGHLHLGHALNKILKDVIFRSRSMMGYNVHYIHGWDCHGLPIEWKIEESYLKKKKNKDEVPVLEFRQECREFAQKWVDVQTAELQRLGVTGDWDNSYRTMTFEAEGQIIDEMSKFLLDGSLYKGAKPVMWSVVEKTSLAEAEVEYMDHKSPSLYIAFPVKSSDNADLTDARAVIWTTTAWTIPCNRALAYNADINYTLIEVDTFKEGSTLRAGLKLVVAEDLLEAFAADSDVESYHVLKTIPGSSLSGTICRHPLNEIGFDYDVPMLAGDFVSTEQGTGLVHMAPSHGEDDFHLCRKHGIDAIRTMDDGGVYTDLIPVFNGQHIFKVTQPVIQALSDAGNLAGAKEITHSYPHSWRSRKPIIFRVVPQWFISMQTTELRDKALQAVEDVRWIPEVSKNRIQAMVGSRPDWNISRQRAWGVPIAIFAHKDTEQPLRDPKIVARIVEAVKKDGADIWYTGDPRRFLEPEYNPEDYIAVTDILDVWFESGCTHAFVVENTPTLNWPVDLYLEGSDQHRGWFQSSLLEACGTRGKAPFKSVLTHGFIVDKNGRKMSKSLGNNISLDDAMKKYGAEIVRLWIVGSNYFEDIRISDEILKHTSDAYRRIRNTMRFLLGSLDGFDSATETVEYKDLPELEKWVLHGLTRMQGLVTKANKTLNYQELFSELHNFCAMELSAFYFDIRKDSLYCDAPTDLKRRACRTVLSHIFEALTRWYAPALCFTMEEAWKTRHGDDAESIHLQQFPEISDLWYNPEVFTKWEEIRGYRRVITGAIELKREQKEIGSSLQAKPVIYASNRAASILENLDIPEIAITSEAILTEGVEAEDAYHLADVAGIAVTIEKAEGEKCERCWKILPEVGSNTAHPTLCNRCSDVVG